MVSHTNMYGHHGSGKGTHKDAPIPLVLSDPSYDRSAHICYIERSSDLEASTNDPNRETTISYGMTKKDRAEVGWMRVDKKGSYYDPDTTKTTAVDLTDESTEVTVYTHIWARTPNDPLAAASTTKESSPLLAREIREKVRRYSASPHLWFDEKS
jgi:hypothetical protein